MGGGGNERRVGTGHSTENSLRNTMCPRSTCGCSTSSVSCRPSTAMWCVFICCAQSVGSEWLTIGVINPLNLEDANFVVGLFQAVLFQAPVSSQSLTSAGISSSIIRTIFTLKRNVPRRLIFTAAGRTTGNLNTGQDANHTSGSGRSAEAAVCISEFYDCS